MAARRVLILGGTAEAAMLAEALDADPTFEAVTSLAGRTLTPGQVKGQVRTGGFGGATGLARYLTGHPIDLVVDATHPFATQISRNAAEACRGTGIPRLTLQRPPWLQQAGDNWVVVEDADAAATYLDGRAERVFLAIGRQTLEPFARLGDIWFLLRMIDRPSNPPPLPRHDLILGRGPFATDAEAELFTTLRIDTIVSKNSGGDATYGKIAAARRLGLSVVMICRPALPDGPYAETVASAIDWIAAQSRRTG